MKEGRDSHLANYNHGEADASGVSVELLFAGKQASRASWFLFWRTFLRPPFSGHIPGLVLFGVPKLSVF